MQYFWSQIYGVLFLHQTLQQDKFEQADFKYDNSIFKFQHKNMQIRHFWSQIQAFLLFHEILQLDKFGVLISNMTILFSNSSPNTEVRHFWFQIQAFSGVFFHQILFYDFCFCTKLWNKVNSRTKILNITKIFSTSTQKICKSGILGHKFKYLYFAPNVAIRQIRRR